MESFDLHIIPECYVDTKLIKSIVPPIGHGYNHQKGCSTVAKTMKEKFGDAFAVGIVDEDKRVLDYTEDFELVCEIPELRLLKHPQKHHYLIFICPAIEKWIILCAEEVGISLTDFDLPHDFKQLSKITKTSTSEDKDPYSSSLKNLFKELNSRGALAVKVLSFWVTYLKENPYNAKIDDIQEKVNQIISLK